MEFAQRRTQKSSMFIVMLIIMLLFVHCFSLFLTTSSYDQTLTQQGNSSSATNTHVLETVSNLDSVSLVVIEKAETFSAGESTRQELRELRDSFEKLFLSLICSAMLWTLCLSVLFLGMSGFCSRSRITLQYIHQSDGKKKSHF